MSEFDNFFADKLGEEGQFPRREKNWRSLSKRLDAFDTGLVENTGRAYRMLRYWQAAAACFILATGGLAWKVVDTCHDNQALRIALGKEQELTRDQNQEIAVLKNAAIQSESHARQAEAESTVLRDALSRQQLPGNLNRYQNSTVIANAPLPPIIPTETTTSQALTVPADSTVSEKNATVLADLPPVYADSIQLAAGFMTRGAIGTDSSQMASKPSQPDSATLASTPKIIEPARNPSRFKAGIHLLSGIPLPNEKGVSMLSGQGLSAWFRIWRDLSLFATADWLRFDISTEKYIPKFHSHNPHQPPNGSPQEKLAKVESTQRQQQFGLGLQYNLPLRTWLRPAVRVAYTMLRVSPELITFKFEDQDPGGPGGAHPPKYTVQRTESKLIQNIWRFGAGLEHDTRDWTFGLWADYSNNFSAPDLTFDAITFRAGLQYKFN